MSAALAIRFPNQTCTACGAVGCTRYCASATGSGYVCGDAACERAIAGASLNERAAYPPHQAPTAPTQQQELPVTQTRTRVPFSVGEIETDVPVPPKTQSEHIAAVLSAMQPEASVALQGASLGSVRRIVNAWLDEWGPTGFQTRDDKPRFRVGFDADGVRVRIWRT